MLRYIPDLVYEHVATEPLLNEVSEVRDGAAGYRAVVVEDTEAEQHSAQPVRHPLLLVVLVGSDLEGRRE